MKTVVLINMLIMANLLCAQDENIVHLVLSDTEKVFPDYKNNTYTKKYYDKDNNLKAEIQYNLRNQKHGKAIWYYPNGQLYYRCQYKNDLLHGNLNSFYLGGEVRSSSKFKNGLLHKQKKTYYKSGQIWIVTKYKKDKPVGTYKRYYSDGTIEFRYDLIGDQSGKRYIYDKNGHAKTGKHEVSLPDERTFITSARNGIADGEFRTLLNGKIRSAGQYVNGYKHGIVYYYDDDGNIEMEELYENGRMIE